MRALEPTEDKPTQAQVSSSKLDRSRSFIALYTLASRILGFIRDSLTASLLGVGPVGGALTMAFRFPNLFRRLFGEGALTAVFLPHYTRTLDGQGENAARRIVSVVFGGLIALLGGVTVLVLLFCFSYPRESLPESFGIGEQLSLTLDYLAILFPYVLLVCGYALATAVLNANGLFLISAAAPAVQNVVAILGLGLAAWLGLKDARAGYLIAWFFLLSGIVQFGMQFPSLIKTRMLVAPSFDWKHPAMKSIAKEMAPLILGLGLVQLNILVDQAIAMAFLGAGANLYIALGSNLLQLPIGILGVSTVTVVFPLFTRLHASGQLKTLRFEMNRALRQIAFLAIPAAIGMAALAMPITKVLFEHGAFKPVDTEETAHVVAMYALAVPALCILPLIARIFYVAGATHLPVRLSAVLVFLNIALSLILVHPLRAAGIALATTIVSWINLLGLVWQLRRLGIPEEDSPLPILAKILLASTFCGGAAQAVYFFTASLGAVFALALSITAGAAVYFVAAYLFHIEECHSFLKSFRRK